MGIRDAWFFGAGASIHAGIPLTKQFIPWLFQEGLLDTRLDLLRAFIEELFGIGLKAEPPLYPKFEQVLSFVDAAISEGQYFSSHWDTKQLLSLRSDFNYLIWRMLRPSEHSPHAPGFQSLVAKADNQTLFLTVNYDLILDHYIHQRFGSIDYGIRFSRRPNKESPPPFQGPVLLKLHGSVNWLYCPTCESLTCYLEQDEIQKIFGSDPLRCHYDDSRLRGILISPTWQKEYKLAPINLMWIKASKLLRDTERITFVGYSLSDIDMKVLYLLKRSLFNSVKSPVIRVIDPEPSGKIARRYQRIFGNIEYHCLGFDDFVTSHY